MFICLLQAAQEKPYAKKNRHWHPRTVWTYFIVCFLVGGVAGGIAGMNDPENAAAAGAAAGEAIVTKYGGIILLGTVLFGVVGTASGFLPGAQRKQVNDS